MGYLGQGCDDPGRIPGLIMHDFRITFQELLDPFHALPVSATVRIGQNGNAQGLAGKDIVYLGGLLNMFIHYRNQYFFRTLHCISYTGWMTQVKRNDVTGQPDAPSSPGYILAHLSDPHLTSLVGVSPGDLLNKRILGYLSWRKHRREEHRLEVLQAMVQDMHELQPDHIVITGDMTHVGLPEECREVRAWLPSVADPERMTIIPGNHDTYVAAPWEKTLGLWAPYMASDQAHAQQQTAFFPGLRVRGPLALISVSSACPTPPFFATGSLGEAQLELLDQMLLATGVQGLIRVLLIHHPPMRDVVGWRKRLSDGDTVCDVIRKRGVEMILHGHTHRSETNLLETRFGSVPVIGVPSASGIGLKPGRRAQYHLCRVFEGPQGWMLDISVRGYDAGLEKFVTQGGQQFHLLGKHITEG